MWYTHYNWVTLSLKEEGNSDACYNMAEPWGHDAKWNKPGRKDIHYMMPFTYGI